MYCIVLYCIDFIVLYCIVLVLVLVLVHGASGKQTHGDFHACIFIFMFHTGYALPGKYQVSDITGRYLQMSHDSSWHHLAGAGVYTDVFKYNNIIQYTYGR